VLAFQGAALASLINAIEFEIWSALIWLGIYCFMLLIKRALHSRGNPEQILESQPASIHVLEPLHFPGRKAALAFIATLPVTHEVDMWIWWDAFMSENARRRELQVELQSLECFMKHLPERTPATEQSELGGLSPSSQLITEEVEEAHKNPELMACLKSYEEAVFPPNKTSKLV
jgi:hypothetical protein